MSKSDIDAFALDVSRVVDGIGPTLRRLREQRRLTLREVAERLDVGISTLSRLESSARNPTLDLLLPLARLYDVALDDIVGAPPTGDPRVRPRTQRRHGAVYIALTTGTGPVQAFKLVLPAHAPPVPPQRHEGYEWLYVLVGALDLEIERQHTLLRPGEAAEFDTRRPHTMTADGNEPVELLALFSPQGQHVHIDTQTRE